MTMIRLEGVTKIFGPEGGAFEELERAWAEGVRELFSGSYREYLRQISPRREGPRRIKALDRVDLLIRHGETMSVIGPTGCGKTTLLKIIAGLLIPDEGTVYYDGVDMRNVPPRDRGIGMVFQNYVLYPHMSSRENLAFFFRLRGRDEEIPERVRIVSKIMGLGFEELLGRMPKDLSAGERQRVAVARCIIRDPKIFLFDEPLSNLDAKLRAQTRVELKRLLKRFSITSVYVTHDQTEAIALADRLAVMNEGRIEQVGTYAEIYNWPVNVFVAGFVGSPSMNFFRCVVEEGLLRHEAFSLPLPRLRRPPRPGQKVILGVRPEHISIGEGPLWAQVEMVQPLVSQRTQLVYARVGRSPCVAKVGADARVRAGDVVPLRFEEDRVHLFDARTEKRLP